MKILLIGGSGFVSGTLARVYVVMGHDVTIVTRGQKTPPPGVRTLVADRHAPGQLEKALADAGFFDFAVDCIGYKPEDARQDVFIVAPICRRFAFISTDFVYDPACRLFPQPESNNHFLRDNSYGADKRRCEEVLLDARANRGFSHWTVFRPCHIYGPGSKLGCLPRHGRDPELIRKINDGQELCLVAGGALLQQPIFAEDLARLILSCVALPASQGEAFNAAGPEIVESVTYYKIIADLLHKPLNVRELPLLQYKQEHPEDISFLCHRIYDLEKIRRFGLAMPTTPLADGLRAHVHSLL